MTPKSRVMALAKNLNVNLGAFLVFFQVSKRIALKMFDISTGFVQIFSALTEHGE